MDVRWVGFHQHYFFIPLVSFFLNRPFIFYSTVSNLGSVPSRLELVHGQDRAGSGRTVRSGRDFRISFLGSGIVEVPDAVIVRGLAGPGPGDVLVTFKGFVLENVIEIRILSEHSKHSLIYFQFRGKWIRVSKGWFTLRQLSL